MPLWSPPGSGTSTISIGGGTAFLTSPSAGQITLLNAAQTGFGALNFGGNTASFPAISRSGTGLIFRLADGSANANISAAIGTFSGLALPSATDKQVQFVDGTTLAGSGDLLFNKTAKYFQVNGQFWASSATSSLAFGPSGDINLIRDGAGILSHRAGATAQSLRVFNAYTDGSNGEWGTFDWSSTTNTLTIGTKANGTGTVRSLGIDVGPVRAMTFDANGIFTAGRIGSGNGLTANDPFTIQQRMNGSAVAFTLVNLNFEDQASAAASNYLRLQYSGTTVAGFQKATGTASGTIFFIGSAPDPTSVDPAISITRGIGTGNTGNAHGISDTSVINRTGTIAYATFDGKPNFNGTNNYDHYAAFQSRPIYQMTGTMANHYGLYDSLTVSSGATVTNRYGGYVVDSTGAGSVGTQYGYYIAPLAAGTTANYGIYVAGNNPSVFGGDVRISSGRKLQLGNAYVGGAITPTGYLTIYDSTGTAYKIPAST